ncbi:hypothetical protein D9C73_028515 [Collichthys lucidus]|uniref:Integrase catalytic domain-containing protein n=1 Tax=Collichthys lucidus TaxID=240159 RepID=A0A4U5TWX6_COLLU|nr:hypothetical protein D9C73_028515 [Collichthys lucidus]
MAEELTEEDYERERELSKFIGSRRGKLGALTRKRNEINVLIESGEDNQTIIRQLELFDKSLNEFYNIQATVQSLMTDEDEREADQRDWYEPKYKLQKDFLEGVLKWVRKRDDGEKGDVDEQEEEEEEEQNEETLNGNVKPQDSVSQTRSVKATSHVSRMSRVSDAQLKEEAECAATRARAHILHQKIDLELEEATIRAQFKARKEKLALNSELAAAEAKQQVYKEHAELRSLSGLHKFGTPTEYNIPATVQRKKGAQVNISPHSETVQHITQQNTGITSAHQSIQISSADGAQIASARAHHNASVASPSAVSPSASNNTPITSVDVTNVTNTNVYDTNVTEVLKKHTEITALLVKQQALSLLPDREIPVFDGDPLQYIAFIRAFEQFVERKTDSMEDRLYYLQQYTKSEPRSLVTSFLHMDPNVAYKQAKEQLEYNFGNGYKIASAYMNKALNWPVIKPENAKELRSYALFLRSCYNTMSDINGLKELDNSSNLRLLVSKLPFKLRDRWRTTVCIMEESKKPRATFKELMEFIEKQARALLDPVFGDIQFPTDTKVTPPKYKLQGKAKPSSSPSFATTVAPMSASIAKQNYSPSTRKQNPPVNMDSCVFCKGKHKLEACETFKTKSNTEKIQYLKTQGMCFGCLRKGHMGKTCQNRMTCETCSLPHPTVLHIPTVKDSRKVKPSNSTSLSNAMVSVKDSDPMGADTSDQCTLAIVPVKVKLSSNNQVITTHAFLDPGSSATFCTESLKSKLNISGKNITIMLCTMGQEKRVSTSVVSGLEVSNMEGVQYHKLPPVYTQSHLPVAKRHIPKQESLDKWTYLHKVKIPHLDADIELLIGTNAAKLMEPWEVINSKGSGPYAVKTPLGWVVNGLMQEAICKGQGSHLCVTANRISIRDVNDLLIKQYHQDFPELAAEDKTEMSVEDKRFMSIMETSKELRNGHYYLPLPFKENNVMMPNNYEQAHQRAMSLKRKFEKNEQFHMEYATFLEGMLERNHAEVVPSNELVPPGGKVWYIPHHAVHHPKKDTLRVVFDCSASFQGTSLNDKLIQGPNLTSNLVGVLLRFRQEHIALMADIESMFHQVRVMENHVDFLRFLWWPNGDLSQPLKEHRMAVHLFGASSSPSCASFALRQCAEDFKELFTPETVATIMSNYYVDDCLKSVPTEADAVKLCRELEAACSMGGFRLHKWISNSRAVLTSIPQADRAREVKTLDLESGELPTERTLGIQWQIQSDKLTFSISLKNQPYTRRGILSIISSVYDPLGFICPFTLTAKNILQDLCKHNYAWDKELPDHYVHQWQEWMSGLSSIGELTVDRCIKPNNCGAITSAQLHHFSDASESGYGCVTYLRLINTRHEVHISFIMGKSRVAPLKQTTMPRMELTAAVLAVRMDTFLRAELQLQLESSIFWTDSTSTLKYIQNENKRFKTFVANRVNTIREMTSITQWRYVNTKQNPADCASRGLKASALLNSHTWLNGPEFLRGQKSEWPKSELVTQTPQENDMEVKKDVLMMNILVKEQNTPTHAFIHHHSNWNKLTRAVAWLLKLKDLLINLSQRRNEILNKLTTSPTSEMKTLLERKMKAVKKCMTSQPMTLNDLKKAEKAIIHYTQLEAFPEEMETLQRKNAHLSRQSRIRMLDPILQNGLLLTGGRLSRMAMPESQKHPVILPKNHHVSKVLLRHIHEQLGHCGRNHVLAKLRQKYWIPAANSLARKIRSECVFCRRQHALLGEQKMADLPKERVTPNSPPFTYVGADYFGPIIVKRGRSEVKRYGVIFTCFTTRAVHLEVASSLDTDSCINAIRRFVSRRGQVQQIRSDNGTNLISADRELRTAIQEWNKSHKLQAALQQKGIEWIYNPPAASHYGGVWERLIKQVKQTLLALTKAQTLDDESLHTFLCEVEAIINSRPLTTISDSPNDLEPLTPNHLLLLKGQPTLSPGLFQKSDTYSKRRWKQVQYLADTFWKRWVREYLPTLQERQKWLKIKRNYTCGDVVLIADPTAPRASWMLGRVIDTKKDAKGVVRSVMLKTKTSVIERPITKVCLLLENDM